MQNIISSSDAVTMSSREISELTNKQHQHVKRDIEKMLSDLGEDASTFGHIYLDTLNRQQTEYRLDRDHVECLLTGYSAMLRMRVVRRLRELEGQAIKPVPAATLPQNYIEALEHLLAAKKSEAAANEALALAAPKVEFVNRYVDNTGSMGFRQVAKLLKAKERQFRQMLLDNHVMYYLSGVLTPYQNHIDAGRFEVKTGTCEHNSHAFAQSRFTPKGIEWVAGLWAKYNIQGAA